MQRNAAVYRTEKTLKEGCDKIDQVYETYPEVKINDKGLVWNTDLIETLELENLLRKMKVILSPGKADHPFSPEPNGVTRSTCERRLPRQRRQELHEAYQLHHP
jgi:hypothetical protein